MTFKRDTRRILDLGFVIAVLSCDEEGDPVLQLIVPETEDNGPKQISVWRAETLRTLWEGLGDYLTEFENQEVMTKTVDTSHPLSDN